MSFEDGGDLASFAAIAESTIVNKEGKHRRVLSATILQNYSLTEQANASLTMFELASISSSHSA